jgi:hypothetical protein
MELLLILWCAIYIKSYVLPAALIQYRIIRNLMYSFGEYEVTTQFFFLGVTLLKEGIKLITFQTFSFSHWPFIVYKVVLGTFFFLLNFFLFHSLRKSKEAICWGVSELCTLSFSRLGLQETGPSSARPLFQDDSCL